MKALAWHGKGDIRCDTVPDPKIEDGRDAIIKVTACAICGSDLHMYDGLIPSMEPGDVVGHETMGEVVEIGRDNKKLKIGDRVVVPFTISCGECFFCKRGFYSGCERSNPNRKGAEELWGHSPAGLFGYSHLLGGFPGGQAEYMRVPFADVGPTKVPDGLSDEQVLFLSDIFPTGYMAADFCGLKDGETVAIWGCGPVGQMAIKSAFLLGAGRVIVRLRCGGRPGEGRNVSGNGPAARAAAGYPLLPQFRGGFDRRRVRRTPRQDPDGFGDQPRTDLPDGANSRATLPPEIDGPHRDGRDRPFLRDHPSSPPGRRARTLQEIP